MAVYQWVSLELVDPHNEDDLWDLATVFEEVDLTRHIDDVPNSPFIFLIQEYTKSCLLYTSPSPRDCS